MKFQYAGMSALCISMLLACNGSNSLSFKNADTLKASYKKLVANMSEVERQDFNRSVMLVINDADTPVDQLDLSDWNAAINQGGDLKHLTAENPMTAALSSELAIKGVKIDGISISKIESKAGEIKSNIYQNEIKESSNRIEKLESVAESLKADKQKITDHKDAALAMKADLKKKSLTYNAKFKSPKIQVGYSGIRVTGDVTMTNPNSVPIVKTNVDVVASANGYKNRQGFRKGLVLDNGAPGSTGKQAVRFEISGYDFKKGNQTLVPFGKKPPTDTSVYSFDVEPLWVQIKTDKGVETITFELPKAVASQISQFEFLNARCDKAISGVNDVIALNRARIEAFKSDSLDMLKGGSSSYAASCAAK